MMPVMMMMVLVLMPVMMAMARRSQPISGPKQHAEKNSKPPSEAKSRRLAEKVTSLHLKPWKKAISKWRETERFF